MTAASIDNEMDNNILQQHNDSIINKKRNTNNHNKTQKRMFKTDFNPEKVNSVLESIHNRLPDDNDMEDNYNPNGQHANAKHSENFTPLNPLAPPTMENVKMSPYNPNEPISKKEGMTNQVPQPADQSELDLQDLQSNFMNDSQVRDYYRKVMPGTNYNQQQQQTYNQHQQQQSHIQQTPMMDSTNQVLADKLNYVINLLEEQQDHKTNNVTEEVVLYSFLGVFIIFVVDSFARVGKYVR
uniref:Uncharacterized protein n=1 Tax=viral metagenome TaxID=1070528 RepID=A0A6C0IW08_9ZZZZ